MITRVRAALLAGGFGERMGVLGRRWPKPLVPFGGCCRLIDFSLANARASGIAETLVLPYHGQSLVTAYLLREWEERQGYAVHLGPMDELVRAGRDPLDLPARDIEHGTADAFVTNREFIDDAAYDDVLVLHADHVYRYDYTEMLATHRASGAALTIGYQRIALRDVPLFGMVVVDEHSGRVTDFVEKPAAPSTDTVFTAFCLFRRTTLFAYLDALARGRWRHDLSHDVIPAMLRNRERVMGIPITSYWADIGTTQRYREAHVELTTDVPSLRLADMPQTLHETPHLPVVHGPRAAGGLDVERSVVFPGARVAPGAEVRRSVLLPGAVVTPRSRVHDAVVIDESAATGAEGSAHGDRSS